MHDFIIAVCMIIILIVPLSILKNSEKHKDNDILVFLVGSIVLVSCFILTEQTDYMKRSNSYDVFDAGYKKAQIIKDFNFSDLPIGTNYVNGEKITVTNNPAYPFDKVVIIGKYAINIENDNEKIIITEISKVQEPNSLKFE